MSCDKVQRINSLRSEEGVLLRRNQRDHSPASAAEHDQCTPGIALPGTTTYCDGRSPSVGACVKSPRNRLSKTMGDYPRQFLPPGVGGVGNPNMMPHDVHQSHIPGVSIPMPSPVIPAAFSGAGYFTAFHDPMMFSVPKTQSQSQRNRRRSASGGLDAVKHRRTRSGCFMCRSRRVKVHNINRTPFIVVHS